MNSTFGPFLYLSISIDFTNLLNSVIHYSTSLFDPLVIPNPALMNLLNRNGHTILGPFWFFFDVFWSKKAAVGTTENQLKRGHKKRARSVPFSWRLRDFNAFCGSPSSKNTWATTKTQTKHFSRTSSKKLSQARKWLPAKPEGQKTPRFQTEKALQKSKKKPKNGGRKVWGLAPPRKNTLPILSQTIHPTKICQIADGTYKNRPNERSS